MEKETKMEELPEECIAHILSFVFTTPVDACRLSLVSKPFCSAADSDAVWDRFLPSDLHSIISDSQSGPSLLSTSRSNKSLYLALSDHPLMIDNGNKSFQLDKWTGKKCYMLSAATDLQISWLDTEPHYKPFPDSRFQQVLHSRTSRVFYVMGELDLLLLSSNTQYAAFFVFKMIDAHNYDEDSIQLLFAAVCLHDEDQNWSNSIYLSESNFEERELDKQEPTKLRCDGWLEIKLGEFNLATEDVAQMSVLDIRVEWKCSFHFLFEGIEIKPIK